MQTATVTLPMKSRSLPTRINKNIEAMAGYFWTSMNKLGIAIQNEKGCLRRCQLILYREFLSWFHKLYAEGLVDVELYTRDSSTWEGKGNQDLYGVSIAYCETMSLPESRLQRKERRFRLHACSEHRQRRNLAARYGRLQRIYRTQAVITNKAEHPEIICRWFDNASSLGERHRLQQRTGWCDCKQRG